MAGKGDGEVVYTLRADDSDLEGDLKSAEKKIEKSTEDTAAKSEQAEKETAETKRRSRQMLPSTINSRMRSRKSQTRNLARSARRLLKDMVKS